MFASELWHGGLIDSLDSHTLHLYEPAWTTDGSLNDDEGLVREPFLIKGTDSLIVGDVAQINDHLADIIVRTVGLAE